MREVDIYISVSCVVLYLLLFRYVPLSSYTNTEVENQIIRQSLIKSTTKKQTVKIAHQLVIKAIKFLRYERDDEIPACNKPFKKPKFTKPCAR